MQASVRTMPVVPTAATAEKTAPKGQRNRQRGRYTKTETTRIAAKTTVPVARASEKNDSTPVEARRFTEYATPMTDAASTPRRTACGTMRFFTRNFLPGSREASS